MKRADVDFDIVVVDVYVQVVDEGFGGVYSFVVTDAIVPKATGDRDCDGEHDCDNRGDN